jgi:hypothetical protein
MVVVVAGEIRTVAFAQLVVSRWQVGGGGWGGWQRKLLMDVFYFLLSALMLDIVEFLGTMDADG